MPKIGDAGDVTRVGSQALRLPAIRATPDTGGAALAQAAAAVADSSFAGQERIVRAEQKVRSREDTINRIRAGTAFDEVAGQAFVTMQTEQDFTDPDVGKSFGKLLNENINKSIASHTGTAESRDLLTIQFEKQRAAHVKRFAAEVNKQQSDMIDRAYDDAARPIIADVDGSVSGVELAFSFLRDMEGKIAPAMTREQLAAKQQASRSAVVLSAITPLLDTGTPEAIDAADALLRSSDVIAALGPDDMRKLKSKIVVGRASAEKGRVEGEQKLEKIAAIAGVAVEDLTPEQRLKAAGIAPPAGRETLSEQVRDFEIVMGRPAKEQEISKMAGAATGEDAIFGKGLAGRAIARVADDAFGFANGTLGDLEDNRYIAAVVELQQPIKFTNPDTGLIEERRRVLPPFVVDALRRRGREDLIVEDEPAVAQAPTTAPADVGPQETIFDMASQITGPVPAAMEALGATPGIGEFVDAGEFTRPRKFVEQMTRDLVRVLQNSPKFAEAEREAIAKDVDLTGSIIDTPKAFRDRIIGMDDALAIRQQNAFNTAQSPLVTRQERQQSMDVLNALTNFRQRLGAPPLIKTPDEVTSLVAEGKLRPGMKFRSPDGVVRVIPEAPQ